MHLKKIKFILFIILSVYITSDLYAEEQKKSTGNFSNPRVTRLIWSIGPEFSIPFNKKNNEYRAGIGINQKLFLGYKDFYFNLGPHLDQLISNKKTYFGSMIGGGYRFDILNIVAFDLSIGAMINVRLGKKLKPKEATIGLYPMLLISYPAYYNYDVSIFFQPIFDVGSKEIFKESYFLIGATFNFKIRMLVEKVPWKE